MRERNVFFGMGLGILLVGGSALAQVKVSPTTMPRMGSVSERYQSYNIEMLEVTGGDFWKPYSSFGKAAAAKTDASVPTGMDASMYEYRAPINLGTVRLRKLAKELGPSYVRVSGTWANSTFFQDAPGPAPATPPEGFKGVLTREEWKGVIDFSKAVDAEIVTSFATSAGTRNAKGVWTPKEATKLLVATKAMGGRIAATEFMNEPTFASMGGAPKGYDAAAYAKDVAVFVPYLKTYAPNAVLLGPGGVGEGGKLAVPGVTLLSSESLMKATGSVWDAFSYHFYGGVSERCSKRMAGAGTTPDAALTATWLESTDGVEAFYAALRDQYEPGKEMWLTETGETACGGDPWAKTFLDSFRYLNQLGSLAQKGVQVVAHNTLAASDYALLDEKTYEPRPNYWAAVLWRRLMGRTVLKPKVTPPENVYVYAQCLRGVTNGVAVLAINADRTKSVTLQMPDSVRYTLSADELQSGSVRLNGTVLQLGPDDALPAMAGVAVKAGTVTLEPETITFFAVKRAENLACRAT
jgi:hypothetical protein